jgi:isoprenylcysteine carboxyl methyltransferase (ICMT) family protein YpbQ
MKWLIVGFLLAAIIERLWERRFSQRAVRGEVKMRWSYAAFHLLHALIYMGTAVEFFWRKPVLNWSVSGLALVLFAVSVGLRLAAIRTLGRFWSLNLEIRPGHEFVRSGIYERMRHPAYTAIVLEVVAIPLVANAWLTATAAALTYIPLLLVRWSVEEKEMVSKFGETYAQYRREVPAFWPRLGGGLRADGGLPVKSD